MMFYIRGPWVCVALAIATSGCDGDTGGTGGSASVLGTVHDCEQMTNTDFEKACAAEGGVVADGCQTGGAAPCDTSGKCYPTPPTPGAGEFVCDGLFNCASGEYCQIHVPIADGCYAHACVPLPSGCTTPGCACFTGGGGGGGGAPDFLSCTEDAQGNPTITTDAM
jgi:hypothetical protein